MKKIILVVIFILLFLFVIIVNKTGNSPKLEENESENSQKLEENQTVIYNTSYDNSSSSYLGEDIQVAKGWSKPIKVPISSKYWEDGEYISQDGNTLYFVIYPGDLATDFQKYTQTGDGSVFKGDLDVYFSKKPFVEKSLFNISKDIYSEGGVMFSGKDV